MDEEVLDLGELPEPPRRLRTVALALVTAVSVTAALLAASLFPEARFALERNTPVEIGDYGTADLPASMNGRYVRGWASLEGAPTVSYQRAGDGEHRLAHVGASRFVDFIVPANASKRFLPPARVSGRLARVGALGLRYRGLAAHLERVEPGASAGWVLVDGTDPDGADWLVGLELLLVVFAGYGLTSIARIVRKVPDAA